MTTPGQFPQEVTADWHMERWRLNQHQTLWVHPRGDCLGDHCAIHNPSDHHMRTWTLYWRSDWGGFLERLCPDNGIGHPDPDQITFWKLSRPLDEAYALVIHGCDGCCRLHGAAHGEDPDGDTGAGYVQQ